MPYHWKHGWIPLTHAAALSKAHGSKTGAARLLKEVPSAHLLRSKDVSVHHEAARNKFILRDRQSGNLTAIDEKLAKHLHDKGYRVTGVQPRGSGQHGSMVHTVDGNGVRRSYPSDGSNLNPVATDAYGGKPGSLQNIFVVEPQKPDINSSISPVTAATQYGPERSAWPDSVLKSVASGGDARSKRELERRRTSAGASDANRAEGDAHQKALRHLKDAGITGDVRVGEVRKHGDGHHVSYSAYASNGAVTHGVVGVSGAGRTTDVAKSTTPEKRAEGNRIANAVRMHGSDRSKWSVTNLRAAAKIGDTQAKRELERRQAGAAPATPASRSNAGIDTKYAIRDAQSEYAALDRKESKSSLTASEKARLAQLRKFLISHGAF